MNAIRPEKVEATETETVDSNLAAVTEVEAGIRDFVRNVFRPPVKGKGWDTFLPIGPYLVEDEIADPHALELRTFVNGELRQRGNTADQLTKVPQLIAYLT